MWHNLGEFHLQKLFERIPALLGGGLEVGEGVAAGGEGGVVTGQQAAAPDVQPPPYCEPDVSGTQVEFVQQYGCAPLAWHGTTPVLPAAEAVPGT